MLVEPGIDLIRPHVVLHSELDAQRGELRVHLADERHLTHVERRVGKLLRRRRLGAGRYVA